MSSARVNRPTSCSSWVIRSAEASDCLSAGSKRVAAFSRSCRFHFESCSSLRLWGPPTHFCLGTFTAESLKNNFGFKLGSEVSSFSFRHRILLSSRWILYHNLVLESGPNFRWQYMRVRQQTLQWTVPPKIDLIIRTSQHKELESKIHNILKALNMHLRDFQARGREWFQTSPDEIVYISTSVLPRFGFRYF